MIRLTSRPVINSLVQTRQSVIAQATDAQYLNTNSWQYAVTTSETCNDGASSNWQGLSTNGFSVNDRGHATVDLATVTIDESTQDKWLCLRVSDNIVSNYGYRSINVDATAPVVNVNQNGARLTASAPSSDRAVSSSWSYVRHTSSFTCDEDAFDIYSPIRRSRSVNLVSADVGDYFCFRVADRYNNYGFSNVYEIRSLDTTAPTLQAVQSNKYLRVSAPNASDIDDDTWEYEDGFASQQDCDEVASRHYREIEDKTIVLRERDVGDWFCIRAADKSGNYGYLSVRIKAVDASAPFVSVDRERNSLTAETDANDVDRQSWQYAISDANDRFDCEEANTDLVFNTASADNYRVALSESDEDKYYCFRVADKSGNHGYGRSEKITNVEVAPVITVVQITGQGRLEVSTNADDVDGLTWGWAVFASDPGDCADVSYTDVTGTGVTTTTRRIIVSDIADTQDGSYYCFRVADTSTTYGYNYGYAKHRYDLGAPTISFSLSADNVLTVSSSATDIDATSWRYARFSVTTDCAKASINRTLPTGNKFALTAADNGSWFCFRVSDTSSNVGYARYEVSGITADAAPTINITQTKLVVIATSADADLNASSWRYAFSAAEPFCGPGNNLVFIYNQGSPNRVNLAGLGSSHNWICFRVSDTGGNVGYAKLQLDRQAPTIKIVQSGTELTVEGTDADLNAKSWSYAKSDSDMTCDASVSFTKLDFNSGKISFDLTAADSGKTFCFRVADRIGNYGYEKIKIDPISLSAPVVTVEQSDTRLTVSADNVDDGSWQYVRSSSDVNCSSANTLSFNAASAANKRVSLETSDNGNWFCFRVRGNNGTYGYAKILVDNVTEQTAPVERPTTPTTPGTTPTTPGTTPTTPVVDDGAGEVETPEETEVDEDETEVEEDDKDGAGEVSADEEKDEDETNWWPIVGIIAGAALVLTIIIVAVVSPSRKNDDDLPGDYV